MRNSAVVPLDLSARPVTFVVGGHNVVVAKPTERRWTVAVDGSALDGTFETQAEAWEAGVRHADRLDAPREHA